MPSGINWTDETWNEWNGCTPASAGCDNCYAEAMANRFWGSRKFSDLQYYPERSYKPLRWRKPRKIFVNSMGDFFHPRALDEWRDKSFAAMALCPEHIFQILTKRPGIMRDYLSDPELPSRVYQQVLSFAFDVDLPGWRYRQFFRLRNNNKKSRTIPLPLDNVWLGVSVENQKQRRIRIPLLLETPARLRFLSVEPLLEGFVIGSKQGELFSTPVRDCGYQADEDFTCCYPDKINPDCSFWDCPSEILGTQLTNIIDWVIVGGESGRGARFCDPAWIADIAESARQHGAAVWVKQLGSNCGLKLKGKGEDWSDPSFPKHLMIREFPSFLRS